jgi:hypothetical protein
LIPHILLPQNALEKLLIGEELKTLGSITPKSITEIAKILQPALLTKVEVWFGG